MFIPGHIPAAMFASKNGHWIVGLRRALTGVIVALLNPQDQVVAHRETTWEEVRRAKDSLDLLGILDVPPPGSPGVPRNAKTWVSWAGFLPGPLTMKVWDRKTSRFAGGTACTTVRMEYVSEEGLWGIHSPIITVWGADDDWRTTFGPDLPYAVQHYLHPDYAPGVIRNHQLGVASVANSSSEEEKSFIVSLAGGGTVRIKSLAGPRREQRCPIADARDVMFPHILDLDWWVANDIPVAIDDTTIAVIDLYGRYYRGRISTYLITYREDTILPGGLVSVPLLRKSYSCPADPDLIRLLLTDPRLALTSGMIAGQIQDVSSSP